MKGERKRKSHINWIREYHQGKFINDKHPKDHKDRFIEEFKLFFCQKKNCWIKQETWRSLIPFHLVCFNNDDANVHGYYFQTNKQTTKKLIISAHLRWNNNEYTPVKDTRLQILKKNPSSICSHFPMNPMIHTYTHTIVETIILFLFFSFQYE